MPLARSAPDTDVSGAARDLAVRPAAVRRLLRAHVQRADGRCAGCDSRPWWPCRTVWLALRADAIRKGLVDEPAS